MLRLVMPSMLPRLEPTGIAALTPALSAEVGHGHCAASRSDAGCAGSIAIDGLLWVVAERVDSERLLARIDRLLGEALQSDSPALRTADHFRERAARATPAEGDTLLDSFGTDEAPQEGDELEPARSSSGVS